MSTDQETFERHAATVRRAAQNDPRILTSLDAIEAAFAQNEQKLRKENEALHAIVRDTANIQIPPDERCQACHSKPGETHRDGCPIVRARREFNY